MLIHCEGPGEGVCRVPSCDSGASGVRGNFGDGEALLRASRVVEWSERRRRGGRRTWKSAVDHGSARANARAARAFIWCRGA